MPQRAIVFIDGDNWYHALKEAGVTNLGDLDYSKITRKLLAFIRIRRDWFSDCYRSRTTVQVGRNQSVTICHLIK